MEALSKVSTSRRAEPANSRRVTFTLPTRRDVHTLWAFAEAMGWKDYVIEETPSREDIISECCGAWSDDCRTTEEIIAAARAAFGSGIIREHATE